MMIPPCSTAWSRWDETFIGGKIKVGRRGQGRWLANKTIVVGAVECGSELRLKVSARADGEHLEAFIEAHVDAIYTDTWRAYTDPVGKIPHLTVNHHAEEWMRGDVHTHTIESVWSLFKRSIIGSCPLVAKE